MREFKSHLPHYLSSRFRTSNKNANKKYNPKDIYMKKNNNNKCDNMPEKTKNNIEKVKKEIGKATVIAAAVAIGFSLVVPKNANAWYNNNYIPTNPNNISTPYTASQSYPGVVIGVRHVQVNYNNNAGNEGAAIGGAAGALAGSQFGKGTGKIGSEIIGGIGGAILGEHTGKYFAEGPATQIIVKMDNNGSIQTITEPGNINVYQGEKVLVVQSQSGRVRVIPDNYQNTNTQINQNQQAQQAYPGSVLTSIESQNNTIVYVKMQNNGNTFRLTVPGHEKFSHGEKVLVSKNPNGTYSVVPEN